MYSHGQNKRNSPVQFFMLNSVIGVQRTTEHSPLRLQMCDGRECAAYTLLVPMLRLARPGPMSTPWSSELESVSAGLSEMANPRCEFAAVTLVADGMDRPSCVREWPSGTLDNDRARRRSLDTAPGHKKGTVGVRLMVPICVPVECGCRVSEIDKKNLSTVRTLIFLNPFASTFQPS